MKLCSFDARSVRAASTIPEETGERIERPSTGIMLRLGEPVGGRVKRLRAVERSISSHP